MQTDASVYIAVGFIGGFLLLWYAVLWFAATVSGWRRLAEQFGNSAPYDGPLTRYASARIRWTNYSYVLNVGASSDGIFLVPIRVYRAFHAPLYIPWGEVHAEPRGHGAWKGLQITFPAMPRTSITLFGRAAAAASPYV